MTNLMRYFSEQSLWGRGFRPLFLLAAAYTVFCVLLWSGFLEGYVGQPSFFSDSTLWHAHEMLYGYVMAVVAGFLLTAVANWTGWAPVRHFHLFILCLLWLLGRVALNIPQIPFAVALGLEALFIPALTISLLVPLYKSRNSLNFVFLFLLTGLFTVDMAVMIGQSLRVLHLTLFFILMMISVIGGRIIPAFTVSALRQRGEGARIIDQPLLDKLAFLSLLAFGAAYLLQGEIDALTAGLTGGLAGMAGLLHLLRLRHYHSFKTWNNPLLWILHIGYLWLVVGLFLMAAAMYGAMPVSVAIHALTAGSIGSLTLGMMCRVALGHSGRPLICGRLTVLSFWLIQWAALLRVLGVWLWPEYYLFWIIASSVLWALGFGLYLVVFTPILLQARPDGQAP